MPSVEEWILSILSAIIHGALMIGVIASSIRFYQYRQTQALQKRYPLLVQLMSLCIVLYFLFQILYKFAFIYGGESSEFQEDNSIGNILRIICSILYFFSIHGVMIMLIARTWFIYFNIKYGIQMQVSADINYKQYISKSFRQTPYYYINVYIEM